MDSLDNLVCCGVSHKTLPLAERERIQPPRERWGDVLDALLGSDGLQTAVLVVTCNRVEFYVKAQSDAEILEPVLDALGAGDDVRQRVRESSYLLRGEQAIRHLFRVAAGLDSMCVGESEVLGQIKEAYSLACRHSTVQNGLHRLFHAAFRVGKQVRNETELGRGVRSLAGAALELMRSASGGLEDKVLVVTGVNRMTETVAARSQSCARMVFVNRTRCKAAALAERHAGESRRLDDLRASMIEADVVFTCTGAGQPIMAAAELEEVLRARRGRKALVICDLAVPRDVEPPAEEDSRLVYLDQTAIQAHVRREDYQRRGQVESAEEIVEEHVAAFWPRLQHGGLPDGARTLVSEARRALERELRFCSKTRTPEEVSMLEQFGSRLVEKVCGLGISRLRAEREASGGHPRSCGHGVPGVPGANGTEVAAAAVEGAPQGRACAGTHRCEMLSFDAPDLADPPKP